MQTKKSTNKFAKVSLVLSAALLIVAATATAAFADEQLLIEEVFLGQLQAQPLIGDGGAFEMVPVEDEPIMDAGDWEMCPVDEEPIVDAGDEAPCPEDEPQLPEGSEEVTEAPVPDGGGDEVAEEPQDDEETPGTSEETETPEPEKPEEHDDEPYLPFTGGNGAPFTLAGIVLAVAGAGYLIRKRHVFDRS